jgi:hypothetical protein
MCFLKKCFCQKRKIVLNKISLSGKFAINFALHAFPIVLIFSGGVRVASVSGDYPVNSTMTLSQKVSSGTCRDFWSV